MVQVGMNIITALLGIGLFFYADTLPGSILAGSKEFIGPPFFPKIVGILLFLLSAGHLVLLIRQRRIGVRGLTNEPEITSRKEGLTRVLVSAGLFGAAVLLIPVVGFYITTFFYGVGSLLFLAAKRDGRTFRRTFLIVWCVMIGIYLLFERLLWVLPPRGILF